MIRIRCLYGSTPMTLIRRIFTDFIREYPYPIFYSSLMII